MTNEQAVDLQPDDETLFDALELPKSQRRIAVRMLYQIKCAQSILLLASMHGRADGFAFGLEVTKAIEPAVRRYLSSVYRSAHDRRLIQLVVFDCGAMYQPACLSTGE